MDAHVKATLKYVLKNVHDVATDNSIYYAAPAAPHNRLQAHLSYQ